jgi:hypothetical protein
MARNTSSRQNAGEAFSRITNSMQESEAFRSLSAPAIRVLLRCLFKNYGAATNRSDGATGRPVFKLTNSEARDHLGMNADTFSRAKNELARKGFLEWVVRGGLRGCNGHASQFALSGAWKHWTPGEDTGAGARKAPGLKPPPRKVEDKPIPMARS